MFSPLFPRCYMRFFLLPLQLKYSLKWQMCLCKLCFEWWRLPPFTSNNSVWELTSKTPINRNPLKSPLSRLLISRVLLRASALWMGLVECYWRWMGSGCCDSGVLKVALKHTPIPNTLCYPTFEGHITRAALNDSRRRLRVDSWTIQQRLRH